MARKPKITQADAALIAIRYAVSRGIVVVGAPEINRSALDGDYHVFIPDGSIFEPGGVLITVDQGSGAARLFPTL